MGSDAERAAGNRVEGSGTVSSASSGEAGAPRAARKGLLEGISRSEPSEEVRARVIAAATARAAATRRARQRNTWAFVGVAAGTLLALGLSLWLPRNDTGSLTEPRPGASRLSAANRDPASPSRSPSTARAAHGLASREPAAASTTRADGDRDVYVALEDIRADLEEIYEMAELIDAERSGERRIIYDRLGECVSTLEDIEGRVGSRMRVRRP